MTHVSIQKRWNACETVSRRAAEVMRLFGLDRYDLRLRPAKCLGRLKIRPGQIGLITGPSGAGKTVLLRELYDSVAPHRRLWLSDIPLEQNAGVIDCIEGSVPQALRILCKAGLSDVFAVLNRPDRLSEGQKYRYRLARALLSRKPCLFADDFGCSLDRPAAEVLAFQIRRAVSETGRMVLAASCHEDLAVPLQPDILIRKNLAGETEIIYPKQRKNVPAAKAQKVGCLQTGRSADSHTQARANFVSLR